MSVESVRIDTWTHGQTWSCGHELNELLYAVKHRERERERDGRES